MKTLIVGAGVIGSFNAARLKEGEQEVTLLARGRRLADLREYGLVLKNPHHHPGPSSGPARSHGWGTNRGAGGIVVQPLEFLPNLRSGRKINIQLTVHSGRGRCASGKGAVIHGHCNH
jgi:choline dehydrogenase-like flavoprotein